MFPIWNHAASQPRSELLDGLQIHSDMAENGRITSQWCEEFSASREGLRREYSKDREGCMRIWRAKSLDEGG